jgi:hypothetical protein
MGGTTQVAGPVHPGWTSTKDQIVVRNLEPDTGHAGVDRRPQPRAALPRLHHTPGAGRYG